MDEELKRALALDDAAKADFERDDWHRAWRAKRSAAPAGVDVDEWLASRPKPKPTPQPQQQPQVAAMAPEVQKLWDAWFDARIQKWVGHKSRLFNAIAESFSIFRAEERKHMHARVVDEIKKQLDAEATKLREEIAGLRMDTVVGRSVLRGELNELREISVKKKTRA